MENQEQTLAEGELPEAEETVIEVDVLPLESSAREITSPSQPLPVVQAAAVAATGIAVGAVAAVAVGRRRTRKSQLAQSGKRNKKRSEFGEVVATRSFLVDLHLLNR